MAALKRRLRQIPFCIRCCSRMKVFFGFTYSIACSDMLTTVQTVLTPDKSDFAVKVGTKFSGTANKRKTGRSHFGVPLR